MRIPEYTISFTPKWHNGCCHEEEEYLFTITYQPFDGAPASRERDVYVWGHGGRRFKSPICCEEPRSRLCVRYGDDDSQYMSLPDLSEFLYLMQGKSMIEDETWTVVADALLNHCTLSAKLNRKTKRKKNLCSDAKGA